MNIKELEQISKDYSWIKVKKYEQSLDVNVLSDKDYNQLLNHHEKETQFLINKCRELAAELLTLKNKEHKRLIITGHGASGKDYLRKILESKGYEYGTSYTTRSPRNGEINGKDYFFISEIEFENMIANNEFYEFVKFNGWYYGTVKEHFHSKDVFLMTPHGVSLIKPEDRKNSLIIFLDTPLEIRKARLMLRNDADSAERRLKTDEIDFKDFNDYDVIINAEKF